MQKKKINGAAVYKCGDHRRFLGLDFGDALIHHNPEPPQVFSSSSSSLEKLFLFKTEYDFAGGCCGGAQKRSRRLGRGKQRGDGVRILPAGGEIGAEKRRGGGGDEKFGIV